MKVIRYIFLLVWVSAGFSLNAQDATEESAPVEPVMELTCLKDTDGKIHRSANLVNYVNRQPIPLPGLTIVFYAGEDSPVRLGESKTNSEGMTVLILDETGHLPAGPEGIRYYAEFEGEGNIMPAGYEVYVMDVNLDMKLELVDSVKTVRVRAWTLVEDEEVPVADEDVYVFVDRMFRDLPLGEDFLDENGELSITVPDDIPGDGDGNIEIIARFDDHYLYGTVENRQAKQWGVPTLYETVMAERTLWTQIAPVWMIVTLTILLVGVWGHYVYVIISLIRINRLGKKDRQPGMV